jgi:hypothetical protein
MRKLRLAPVARLGAGSAVAEMLSRELRLGRGRQEISLVALVVWLMLQAPGNLTWAGKRRERIARRIRIQKFGSFVDSC